MARHKEVVAFELTRRGRMKILLLCLAVLALAVVAYASGETDAVAPEEVSVPPLMAEFYCQPPHIYLQTYNACTAFDSEVADDIPDDFVGVEINDVVFYVSEWGGAWVDPAGVYVNFYTGECPPALVADKSFFFAWADVEREIIYNDPGYFTCYRVQVYLPELVTITADMSLGLTVDNPWGQTTPYCGIVVTDDGITYGDCGCYWSPEYWGYPRWTYGLDYFGVDRDVAYCLSSPSAGGGELIFHECYINGGIITGYFFSVTAGTLPVNDIEICALIDDEYAPVWNCSVPASWYCHFDEGSHCVDYYTIDNPILPGETYGPFDIWIDPPYCYPTLTIIWTLTLDGEIIAGPDTAYWDCGPTASEPTTWGGIKSLYK
jgi:hypothetical protein